MELNYLRMIRAMLARARGGRKEWSVYIARCKDGSLYTGIAKDVQRRLAQHNKGQGSAYARSRRPVVLVYREERMTRSQALVREAAIKRLPRAGKERLVVEGPRGRRKRSGKRQPLRAPALTRHFRLPGDQAPARAQRRGSGRGSKSGRR